MKFNELLSEFTGGKDGQGGSGGMTALGSVAGDALSLIGDESKYTGGKKGKAIGGGIGTGIGAIFGMPGVGQAVGSMIGGFIGGQNDKENMINDAEDVQRKKYSKLNLAANVNPYGSDNALYMAEGGMIEMEDPVTGGTSPIARKMRTYGSQAEIDAANATAQRLAAKNLHDNAANVTIGRKVGDPVIPYVNERGMNITGAMDLFGTKQLPTKLPMGVTAADVQSNQGIYWYTDPHTGDTVDVDPSVVNKKATPVMKKGGKVGCMKKGGMAFAGILEEGGMSPDQEPEMSMVNIEKGEILIDPVTLKVIRKYDNPNRYKPHSDKPMFEAVGNFTPIQKGHVVIPKKYADRFIKGDELARQSIVAEILKNQANEPTPTRSVPQMEDGGIDPPRLRGMSDSYDPAEAGILKLINGNSPANAFNLGSRILTSSDPAEFNNDFDLGNRSPAAVLRPGNKPGMMPEIFGEPDAVTGPGRKINKNLLSSKIIGAIPTSFGIANALGTDPFLRYDENTQFDQAKAYAQDMETTPNIEASKAAIRRTNAGRNQVLNNFNSPSTRAEVAANNVAGLKAEGDLIQNASNMAMEMRNRKRETLGRLEEAQGQGRLSQRKALMDELRMDKANRETMIHQGLSEGATNYQQGVMDEERIKALNTMATYWKLDPYSASLLADNGEYMGRIMESLGALKGSVPGTRTTGKQTNIASTTRDRVGNVKQTKQTKITKN